MQSCTTARSGIGAPVLGFLRSLCQVPGFGFWVSTLLNPQKFRRGEIESGDSVEIPPFFLLWALQPIHTSLQNRGVPRRTQGATFALQLAVEAIIQFGLGFLPNFERRN